MGSRAWWLAVTCGVLLPACKGGETRAPQPAAAEHADPVDRGRITFSGRCSRCHPGGGAGMGPSLLGKEFSHERLRSQVRNGVGVMPAFGTDKISDAQLEDLIAFVKTLQSR